MFWLYVYEHSENFNNLSKVKECDKFKPMDKTTNKNKRYYNNTSKYLTRAYGETQKI
jgi:hypothetical protein